MGRLPSSHVVHEISTEPMININIIMHGERREANYTVAHRRRTLGGRTTPGREGTAREVACQLAAPTGYHAVVRLNICGRSL